MKAMKGGMKATCATKQGTKDHNKSRLGISFEDRLVLEVGGGKLLGMALMGGL